MPHTILRRSWEIAVAHETFDTDKSLIEQTLHESSDIIDSNPHWFVITLLIIGIVSLIILIAQVAVCCYCFKLLQLQRYTSRTQVLMACCRLLCNCRHWTENMRAAMIPHPRVPRRNTTRGANHDVGVSEELELQEVLTGHSLDLSLD